MDARKELLSANHPPPCDADAWLVDKLEGQKAVLRAEVERLRSGISELCSCQFPGDVCAACYLLEAK